mmetsp:Transcript_26282/g.39795  ORF Transcript_26282/g.39795 Transcript_26282/m.39795 type:complete len:102 (-) Transcript_26282:137-442(-)
MTRTPNQCKTPNRSSRSLLDDSSSSSHDSRTFTNRNFMNDDGNNQDHVQRRVQFSDMKDKVYFFEKAPLKDYPCLWYGCHELQRMIDESRLAEKEAQSSTS